MELWRRREAESPLLVDVPHAGTYVPSVLQSRFAPEALPLPDTDWHVDRLFAFAERMGAGLLAATHSRYVVDLNRDPEGLALYPQAHNTELVPLTRFDFQPIYQEGKAPDDAEVESRIETYWRPYHERLQADINVVVQRFGYCILIDGHSIPHQVPRFFEGTLPDLNLGTDKGRSAAPSVIDTAWRILDDQTAFSHVLDGRFTGGYITRHYGQPHRNVHALQIEIVQNAYMDEANPSLFDEGRASGLTDILKDMIAALLRLRP
jgi:N-formylglutamate amidohydrolase